MRIHMSTALVLRAMLDAPKTPRYGFELMQMTGLASGTMYPIMTRLQAEGLVTSELEDIDPRQEERPRRRYYQLTQEGTEFAVRELERIASRLRPPPSALRALTGL